MKNSLALLILFSSLLSYSNSFATLIETEPDKEPVSVDLSTCLTCEGTVFTFSGEDLLFIRILDENMKFVELNASIRKGEMTYAFRKPGTYFMEFNHINGFKEMRKIVVP